MNEKELAELTDATVKAIKAEVVTSGMAWPERDPDWDLIWTVAANALMEASRKGSAAAPDLLERLKHLVAVVPEPEMIHSLDEPPSHRTQEEHEIGYALHLAKEAIAKATT